MSAPVHVPTPEQTKAQQGLHTARVFAYLAFAAWAISVIASFIQPGDQTVRNLMFFAIWATAKMLVASYRADLADANTKALADHIDRQRGLK